MLLHNTLYGGLPFFLVCRLQSVCACPAVGWALETSCYPPLLLPGTYVQLEIEIVYAYISKMCTSHNVWHSIWSLIPRASPFYLLISVHNNTQEQKTGARFSPIFHSHLLSVNGRYEWGRPGNEATQYVWYMLITPYSTCTIYTCTYGTLASIL